MVFQWVYVFTLLLICFSANAYDSDAYDPSIGSNQRHLRSIGKVKNFRLINADTNLPIATLKNGMVIDVATLSTENLNVQATTTNGTIVAIRFGYNGNAKFQMVHQSGITMCVRNLSSEIIMLVLQLILYPAKSVLKKISFTITKGIERMIPILRQKVQVKKSHQNRQLPVVARSKRYEKMKYI